VSTSANSTTGGPVITRGGRGPLAAPNRGRTALASPPSWEALRAYVTLLRAVLDGLPFAVAMIDRDGVMPLWNNELSELLSAPPSGGGDNDLASLVRELRRVVVDPDEFEARLREAVHDPVHAAEFEVALRDGGALAITAGAVPLDDGATVLCFRDATGELCARRELEHRALHDPLTDLPNRELLMDRLSVALARLGRQGTGVGVLFIDLDGFKAINDEHGHAVGDELLVSIAARLRREVRDGDTVARYGGDEFVVLCEDLTHVGSAQPLADRLAAAIAQPVSAGERVLAVQASVGVVVERSPATTADALLMRADAEMYRVKQRSR
jgi:diguanylate cyclase (GGDEF)-like protein